MRRFRLIEDNNRRPIRKNRRINEIALRSYEDDIRSDVYNALADIVYKYSINKHFTDTDMLHKWVNQAIEWFDIRFWEDEEFDRDEDFEESLREEKSMDCSVNDCQKWVDYDMKKYGHISSRTEKYIKQSGYSIVKDQYGDYEVIADRD